MQLTSLSAACRRACTLLLLALMALASSAPLMAQGGEAELKLPDLSQALFLNGSVTGPTPSSGARPDSVDGVATGEYGTAASM